MQGFVQYLDSHLFTYLAILFAIISQTILKSSVLNAIMLENSNNNISISKKDILTVDQLIKDNPKTFKTLEENLAMALSLDIEGLKLGVALHHSSLTIHDLRWLFGHRTSIDEVTERAVGTGIYIMRLINQQPELVYQISLPVGEINFNRFFDAFELFAPIYNPIRSLLVGYSPNYTRIHELVNSRSQALRILYQLLNLDLQIYGEFAVVSALCRAKKDSSAMDRSIVSLNRYIQNAKKEGNFSKGALDLIEKHYYTIPTD